MLEAFTLSFAVLPSMPIKWFFSPVLKFTAAALENQLFCACHFPLMHHFEKWQSLYLVAIALLPRSIHCQAVGDLNLVWNYPEHHFVNMQSKNLGLHN